MMTKIFIMLILLLSHTALYFKGHNEGTSRTRNKLNALEGKHSDVSPLETKQAPATMATENVELTETPPPQDHQPLTPIEPEMILSEEVIDTEVVEPETERAVASEDEWPVEKNPETDDQPTETP